MSDPEGRHAIMPTHPLEFVVLSSCHRQEVKSLFAALTLQSAGCIALFSGEASFLLQAGLLAGGRPPPTVGFAD